MTELDPTSTPTLEYGRNFTSIPLPMGRRAVNAAGIYVFDRQESITDAFEPLEGSENPQIIKADE